MDRNKSLENRQKLEETSKRRDLLLRKCMATLAVGLGVEITPERVMLYLRPLSDLDESQIKRGFELALREYKPFGGSFPSPGEIREYALRAERHVGLINDAPEVLSRQDKPADWEPLSAEQIAEFKRRVAEVAQSKAIH